MYEIIGGKYMFYNMPLYFDVDFEVIDSGLIK